MQDPADRQDGKITDKGMAELRAKMPHADLSAVEESRDVEDFEKAFTVRTLVEFVKSKV